MAPKKAGKSSVETSVAGIAINMNLLSQINAGQVTRISQADGLPLLTNQPPLIEVNTNDVVDGMAACRVTPEGAKMVQANNPTNTEAETTSQFAILNNVVLPARKRLGRGAGAPSQYPFDSLEIGQSFFVPKSVKHPNPVKTLASTISAQNMKYSLPTGAKHEVERTKRGAGNKAMTDEAGNKIKEKVMVDVRKPTRKFAMRSVKQGDDLGGAYKAEADGVIIQRVALD